jgi:hypothetical protein
MAPSQCIATMPVGVAYVRWQCETKSAINALVLLDFFALSSNRQDAGI